MKISSQNPYHFGLPSEPVLHCVVSRPGGDASGVKSSSQTNPLSLCHLTMAEIVFGEDKDSFVLMAQFKKWITIEEALSWSAVA